MINNTKWFIAFVLILIMAICVNAQKKSEIIDLSEIIFKTYKGNISNLGPTGFGVHDLGAEKYKVFDWDCKLIKEFPLIKGEGPGEIKRNVMSACIAKNGEYLLYGGNGFLINRYDSNGKYINSFRIDFYPNRMVYKNEKLYIFSCLFSFSKPGSLFGGIYDPITGKLLKELRSKEIIDKNALECVKFLSDIYVAIDDKGVIHILFGNTGSIYKVSEDGELIQTIALPYKDKKEMKKSKVFTVSWKQFYTGIAIIEGSIYVGFLDLSYDKGKPDKSRLIRIDENGKISEKVFLERYAMIGHSRDKILFFQDMEFFVRPIHLTELTK